MPAPFDPLGETLLRGGVAPAHVRRYLRELYDHFADLADEELNAGRSRAEAETAARARLGGDEALAGAMLAQPSLRSWTGRAPWATLVIAPFLMVVLAWILACLGVILLLYGWIPHPHGLFQPPAWLQLAWLAKVGAALLDLAQVGGPLLTVIWVARLGALQRSRLIWPLLGCVAGALFGASFHWDARWPVVGSHLSSVSVGIRGLHPGRSAVHFSLAVWSQSLVMGAVYLAVAGAAYWMARRRSLAAG